MQVICKSYHSIQMMKKMRPNNQRLKEIIRDEVIGLIWKYFKIIIHIFKNRCNETEKKCFNGKFHQIRGIYKIIVKFKIRNKKFETSIYVFKSN